MAGRVIGISLLTRTHHFYKEMEKGILFQAKKNNEKVLIESAEFDAIVQKEQVSRFIEMNVDAIVICPVDSIDVGNTILMANDARIPVFTADTASKSRKGQVVSHITSDNTKGGRKAGKLLGRAIRYEGKVAIIDHPGITGVEKRVKGFKKAIAKHPRIKIIGTIPAWGSRKKAKSAMAYLLKNEPDLKGVFAINDEHALGVVEVLKKKGMQGKIMVVGYDATPEGRKAIAEGYIYADVVQNPIMIGHEIIEHIDELFEGIEIPKEVRVEVGVWT